jgi:hypothetical protein
MNKNKPQNTKRKPESENTKQKADKAGLSKFYGLYNIWTGFSGFLALVASAFFHGILATILLIVGAILFLFAVHLELDEHFGKQSWFVVPLIVLLILAFFVYDRLTTPSNVPMGNLPYVNYRIEKLSLDSIRGKLTLNLRFVNTSNHLSALNLYRSTTILCDSVSASDSSWAVDILKRHKNEGLTLKPREIMGVPIDIGEMKSSIKNRKAGSIIGGVREYFKNMDLYVMGAYSYLDEANNRYLCVYCISYDPWTDHQRPYPKYNINIPVNWR